MADLLVIHWTEDAGWSGLGPLGISEWKQIVLCTEFGKLPFGDGTEREESGGILTATPCALYYFFRTAISAKMAGVGVPTMSISIPPVISTGVDVSTYI